MSRHQDSAASTGTPPAQVPHVAILLCSYNGEKFLREQLDSIEAQTFPNWKVWVSDDGSRDGTLQILNEYRQRWGGDRLEIVRGPSRGFAANFLSVACRHEIHADYFSYADQDDIWEADKLERAVTCLEKLGVELPALYCSRTRLIDEAGAELGLSPLFTQKPDFRNALVQNVGGGNTMVFNAAGRQLLLDAGPDLDVVAHDWWTYVAISAAGGTIVYDPQPSLLYRQHGGNLIGSNQGLGARLARVRLLLKGQLREWIDANVAGLGRIQGRLPYAQLQIFLEFDSSRHGGIIRRLAGLRRSGVYRQTVGGNIGLIVASFFKKL
ncbi:glycosyl transferase family 2 [Bordetella bronchialis]|uniref:Glycosyl transferase family 2 n=1 Tax=Bordetella bronchialis TaxID=463025 RepID=A0A193G4W8_9BORD|nr:glycosyl transferase family 2 [Bordetella bronchialis]ANN74254.1 glycosyl transferase family 2 [Bordetella bronchialis]